MKSLYEKESLDELLSRINKLTPSTQRLWGKMSVGQMLAHCTIGCQAATGDKYFPQLFMGKLLGRFVKVVITKEGPFRKNSPTNPQYVVTNPETFDLEKGKLTAILTKFSTGGPSACTSNKHSFFGKLTPEEWGLLMYKHMDHHLRQFGV